MFVFHSSNKTENLLAHLNKVLEAPLSQPFRKEEFLIQSQGMERWLSQQLADYNGVWANFDFHFPGKFFGNIVDQLMETESGQSDNNRYSQESLVWHLDRLLRDLNTDESSEGAEVLSCYMQGDNEDLKRYQLAEKLAFLFDQYQFMRPDWMQAWKKSQLVTNNPSERWQRDLWQQLETEGKGCLWLEAINILKVMAPDAARELLPERLSVFGINGMSPIYLHFLQAIGELIDVHFYLLNPAQAYWADLPGKRQRAKQMLLEQESREPLFMTGNPLLSSLGQQGRDFQQLLLEQCDFEAKFESFHDNGSSTLLASIQNDILNNTITDKADANDTLQNSLKSDQSLSIHACHSRMREVEVLKDQLLRCLDNDAALSLRGMVVMAPDMSQYAPYISAVFGDIPHAIADKNMLDSNNPLGLLLKFLNLSQNRWEVESVFDVLNQPVVHQKFGLLEAELESIQVWVSDTQIRWGESEQHREDCGFVGFSENSWKAGLDRLLMGYANADDDQFCGNINSAAQVASQPLDGILPFSEIEGSQAQALGGLYDFISLLSEAKKECAKSYTLEAWIKRLSYYTERLLASDNDFQHQHTAILELINSLDDFTSFHKEKVSLDVMVAWLTTSATSQQSAAGFLRGQLTFCSMLPMRAIPFKVIALMGMNESEYPRQDTRPAFDLMANDFRKGDKSPRVDERYQFLEVLLCAQQQLIITYIGQSKSTNSTIQPSVVVSELLEVLGESYSHRHCTDVLKKHWLQAHSAAYFSASDDYFSYSSYHLLAAKALQQPQQNGDKHWWQGAVNDDQKTVIELHDLLAFYQHPQRHFIQQQLHITPPRMGNRAEEIEPLVMDTLSQYQIDEEWIEQQLVGSYDEAAFYKKLVAKGRWLSASHGRIHFAEQKLARSDFVEQVNDLCLGKATEPLSVDFTVGDYRIVGVLGHQYQKGSLIYRYAALKGKDLLPAWISHLVSQQIGTNDTWLLAKDEYWCFSKVVDAGVLLETLVAVYIEGQQKPSPLLIEPSMAWQAQQNKRGVQVSPLQSAQQKYQKGFKYDSFLQLLYSQHTVEEVVGELFEEACQLLNPIWEHRVIVEG